MPKVTERERTADQNSLVDSAVVIAEDRFVGAAAIGREHRIVAGDGRVLQVLERGRPDGKPVLVHNGMPNSRLIYEPDVRCAERQDIRLISYDRPGYGGSTSQPGRTVADCAQDVRAIAAGLKLARLAIWGISGGGPHALACAGCCPTSSLPSRYSPR